MDGRGVKILDNSLILTVFFPRQAPCPMGVQRPTAWHVSQEEADCRFDSLNPAP